MFKLSKAFVGAMNERFAQSREMSAEEVEEAVIELSLGEAFMLAGEVYALLLEVEEAE